MQQCLLYLRNYFNIYIILARMNREEECRLIKKKKLISMFTHWKISSPFQILSYFSFSFLESCRCIMLLHARVIPRQICVIVDLYRVAIQRDRNLHRGNGGFPSNPSSITRFPMTHRMCQ